MEDYFHLNLKKFVADVGASSEDVKPNQANMPSDAGETAVDRTNGTRTREWSTARADNTDPYNSTGRFNLKIADA